jgi:dTMP kinase
MSASRPLFVTLEGIEGCGKSTQIRRLAAFLAGAGVPCTVTREPGGTAAGEEIRSVLLAPREPALTPLADLMLYAAARAQHLAEVIEPALAAGSTVLCDRYSDATIAYQAFASGLPLAHIQHVHALPGLDRKPDLTLLLDLDAQVGLERARARQAQDGDHLTRFEEEDLQYHRKVRDGYLELARMEPERFAVIDGSGDEDTVFTRLSAALAARLGMET